MKRFSINTLGCKVNQYESQQIRQLLERLGVEHVATTDAPDLVVINTCCVTHSASAKSRQYIRKAQKLCPDAVIVVCGCLPRLQTGELNPCESVHVIRHHDTLATKLGQIVIDGETSSASKNIQADLQHLIKAENCYKIKHKNKLSGQQELPQLTSFKGQTRAFLKIQDGCDGYCSYCIIPRTRPNVRSKPVGAVLQEAQALVNAGHKEIVVTGIFLGAYGQRSVRPKIWEGRRNDKLADLLEKMAEIPNPARIRVSSLEPMDVTPRLLDTFCKHPNIMPHIHLSLQSGSNAVLERMRRQYTTDDFMRTVDSIRSRLDRPAITTDIIVGFPRETELDFQQTVELAREVVFAKMHVFSFSPRKGTPAAAMQGAVNNRVIKERSKILRSLDIELGAEFRKQFVGETATILVENTDGQLSGRSERYFLVYLKETDQTCRKNELVRVRLTKNSNNGMFGQIRQDW